MEGRERAGGEGLGGLLGELRGVEERLDSLVAFHLEGRSPAVEETKREIDGLRRRRAAVLERMATEAMPVGEWVRHGRRLFYLHPLVDFGDEHAKHRLFEFPARYARWIPEGVSEYPGVTLNRAVYAGWRRRARLQLGVLAAVVGGAAFSFVALAYAVSTGTALWLLSAVPLAVSLLFGLVVGMVGDRMLSEVRPYLARAFSGEGNPDPFGEVSPGTGEPSPRVKQARRTSRRARRAERRLKERVSPAPTVPLEKTHDYVYGYTGRLADDEAACRVRIYQPPSQHGRPKDAPVVVLSQSHKGLREPSISSLIGAIAAEVTKEKLPHLLPKNLLSEWVARRSPPVRVVEHYFGASFYGGPDRGEEEEDLFAVVVFGGYRLADEEEREPGGEETVGTEGEGETSIGKRAADPQRRFRHPEWHHVKREEVERMIGAPLPPASPRPEG